MSNGYLIVAVKDEYGSTIAWGEWKENKITFVAFGNASIVVVVVNGFCVFRRERAMIAGDKATVHVDETTSKTLKHLLVKGSASGYR